MREGALLQTIHFASLLVDPANVTGGFVNLSHVLSVLLFLGGDACVDGSRRSTVVKQMLSLFHPHS